MYLGIRYAPYWPNRRTIRMCPGFYYWSYAQHVKARYYERLTWMKGAQKEWNHRRKPKRVDR
jgi:hypothetical protein